MQLTLENNCITLNKFKYDATSSLMNLNKFKLFQMHGPAAAALRRQPCGGSPVVMAARAAEETLTVSALRKRPCGGWLFVLEQVQTGFNAF